MSSAQQGPPASAAPFGASEPGGPPRADAARRQAGWGPTGLLGAVLLATVLAYAPSLGGDFVWDDVILIRDNQSLHDLPRALREAGGDLFGGSAGERSLRSGYARPVVVLLNALTWSAFGGRPLPYRASNLALHLAAVLLLAGLLRRLGLSSWAAAVAAAVFALHPAQTEAVAFISGRPDLLAALACLAAACLYFDARRRPGRAARARLGAALLCALCGLGAKEIALVLPVALAAAELLGLGRSAAPPRERARWALGLLLVALGLAALRLTLGPTPGLAGAPLGARIWAAGRLVWLYAGLLFVPLDGRVSFDGLPLGAAGLRAAAGLAVAGVALGVAALQARQRPRWALACLWLLLFLLPVLQLVPLPTAAAQRYLYLPLVGLALAAGLGVDGLLRGLRARPLAQRWGVAAALGLAVAGLAWGSAARAATWHDELILWRSEIARGHAGTAALQNLAAALAERGERGQAARLLLRAWESQPGHPVVFRSLIRLISAGDLPPEPPLAPPLRRDLLAAALAGRPKRAELLDWAGRLAQQGHPMTAELLLQRVDPKRAVSAPLGAALRPPRPPQSGPAEGTSGPAGASSPRPDGASAAP